MAHNGPDYLHLFTECMKAAMAEREYHFGDPAFVDVPLDRLLSDAHLAARLRGIDPGRALAGMPEPILGPAGAGHRPEASPASLPTVEADASYCAVVDRWGNAFS